MSKERLRDEAFNKGLERGSAGKETAGSNVLEGAEEKQARSDGYQAGRQARETRGDDKKKAE